MATCKHLLFANTDKDSYIEFCVDDMHGMIDISVNIMGDAYALSLDEDESRRLVKEIAKLAKP